MIIRRARVLGRPGNISEIINRLGSLVIIGPLPNLVKVLARMRGAHVAEHALALFAPFPVDGPDISITHDGLAHLVVAVLHVIDVVQTFFGIRVELLRECSGIHELAHHVEAVELVEDIELYIVFGRVVPGGRCCVRQLNSQLFRDGRYPNDWKSRLG